VTSSRAGGAADQTLNDADVAADDVDTLSGLLEAVAILMTSVQPALNKVCFVWNLYNVHGLSVSVLLDVA